MAAGRDVSDWALAGPKGEWVRLKRRVMCLKICKNVESHREGGVQPFLFRCYLFRVEVEWINFQFFTGPEHGTGQPLPSERFCLQARTISAAFKTKAERRLAMTGTYEGTLGDTLGSRRTTFRIVSTAQASLALCCDLFCLSLIHPVSVHEQETSHRRANCFAVLNEGFTNGSGRGRVGC